MRLETVGTWRGISSAVGLLGTFVYHISAKYLSQESSGMWSICFQFCCISVSFYSLWIENYDLFLVMFIGGVCLSRVGLWVFDIAVTQLMQERVASESRGVVGGVQQSLNAFFGLFAFALGLIFPDPRQFFIYVGVGYLSVGLATIFFFVGVFVPSRLVSQYESVGDSVTPRT
jgi:iron-regulated transporter 1